jgi:hypothetical protein
VDPDPDPACQADPEPGLHKGRPSNKPSALKREHLAIQKMKFVTFLWVIFALYIDPDSQHCF